MSADNFLQCLRRFIAKRGKPMMIISGNASQLGQNIIDEIWKIVPNDKELQSYVSNEGVIWKYMWIMPLGKVVITRDWLD